MGDVCRCSQPEALPEPPSQLLKPGGILVFEHLMDESGQRARSRMAAQT
jgi:hypothetical protein